MTHTGTDPLCRISRGSRYDTGDRRPGPSLGLELRARLPRLEILINNAGIIPNERRLTADGVEASLAVNRVAHHVLTLELLDLLQASAPARVVMLIGKARAHRHGRPELRARLRRRHCLLSCQVRQHAVSHRSRRSAVRGGLYGNGKSIPGFLKPKGWDDPALAAQMFEQTERLIGTR